VDRESGPVLALWKAGNLLAPARRVPGSRAMVGVASCLKGMRRKSASCHKQSSRIIKIRVLQEQISELLVRGHQLPDVILDFETGMNDGPIMRSSDKCEKRKQILKAFTAQRFPHYLQGALGLRRCHLSRVIGGYPFGAL